MRFSKFKRALWKVVHIYGGIERGRLGLVLCSDVSWGILHSSNNLYEMTTLTLSYS